MTKEARIPRPAERAALVERVRETRQLFERLLSLTKTIDLGLDYWRPHTEQSPQLRQNNARNSRLRLLSWRSWRLAAAARLVNSVCPLRFTVIRNGSNRPGTSTRNTKTRGDHK